MDPPNADDMPVPGHAPGALQPEAVGRQFAKQRQLISNGADALSCESLARLRLLRQQILALLRQHPILRHIALLWRAPLRPLGVAGITRDSQREFGVNLCLGLDRLPAICHVIWCCAASEQQRASTTISIRAR